MTRWPARRPPAAAVPEELARFVHSEWPQPDVWAAFAAWKAARMAWMDANYPPGAIAPWGDRLDMLRFELQTRRRLAGIPS